MSDYVEEVGRIKAVFDNIARLETDRPRLAVAALMMAAFEITVYQHMGAAAIGEIIALCCKKYYPDNVTVEEIFADGDHAPPA